MRRLRDGLVAYLRRHLVRDSESVRRDGSNGDAADAVDAAAAAITKAS